MTEDRYNAERLQRLEEGQGFTERAVDELADEVRALGRRVQELAALVARLEARLRAAQNGASEEE